MAKVSQFVFIFLTFALLAAIALCALTPSPNMREMWWIPGWLGEWADRHGNFRNFPVFAAFAALLFFVWNLLSPVSEIRPQGSDKSFGLLVRWSPRRPVSGLLTSGCLLVLRRAALCFCAAAILGASLEAAQLFLPHRWADPMDVLWSSLGAFVGAAIAVACFRFLTH